MNVEKIREAVIDGDVTATSDLTREALDAGLDADTILKEGLIEAMTVVGDLFEKQEYFIPEMLASAMAMKGALTHLRPLLAAADIASKGRIVIGTVKGDLHDIGKNLVSMMLEGAGFEVVDLGADVPAEKFVENAANADIIGLSALLTTTMPQMRNVIDAIVASGLRDKVKIMVGGAPVTQEYADEIGADAYSLDASAAVREAKALMG